MIDLQGATYGYLIYSQRRQWALVATLLVEDGFLQPGLLASESQIPEGKCMQSLQERKLENTKFKRDFVSLVLANMLGKLSLSCVPSPDKCLILKSFQKEKD